MLKNLNKNFFNKRAGQHFLHFENSDTIKNTTANAANKQLQ